MSAVLDPVPLAPLRQIALEHLHRPLMTNQVPRHVKIPLSAPESDKLI